MVCGIPNHCPGILCWFVPTYSESVLQTSRDPVSIMDSCNKMYVRPESYFVFQHHRRTLCFYISSSTEFLIAPQETFDGILITFIVPSVFA